MKTNKILITACMLIGITAGWLMGSFTASAFSQSNNRKLNESLNLPSISINGETLPTIILSEYSVVSK